jgi:hypothetical protein
LLLILLLLIFIMPVTVYSLRRCAAAAAQVSESELDKKGDGYVLKSDPSIKVHARAHKVCSMHAMQCFAFSHFLT